MVVSTDIVSLGELVWGRRIEIPPIQRDYAWTISGKKQSAKQLITDLMSFHLNTKEGIIILATLLLS